MTYQLKILTTALFSVLMLGKPLSRLQWLALFILFCGVALVQVQPSNSSQSKVAVEQRPLLGLVAVLVQCCLSGFAGVYFEKILKGTNQSIWLRNVQLGIIGSVIGLITMEINDGPKVTEKGFFFGYDYVVWTVICLQSFGGLVVAVVVKYADNILKGFATSGAIIISCIAAIYFFDFHLSLQFFVGATLVIISVFMYSKYVPMKPIATLTVNQKVWCCPVFFTFRSAYDTEFVHTCVSYCYLKTKFVSYFLYDVMKTNFILFLYITIYFVILTKYYAILRTQCKIVFLYSQQQANWQWQLAQKDN